MAFELAFEPLILSVEAEAVETQPDGYILHGADVQLRHPFGATRFYRHGWQSWSPTLWVDLRQPPVAPLPVERRPQMDDPALLARAQHSGSGVGALEGAGGQVLLLGALDLDAIVWADTQTLNGHRRGESGRWFIAYGDEETVFAAYAARLSAAFGAQVRRAAPRVWCSWYGLYTRITQDILYAVLDDLSGLSFEVFQVDDGWQLDMGDWEANAKFPAGMEALARHIRAAGLTPGLWMAPFIVRPSAALYRDHPEWLLRDADGDPVPAGHNWGGPYYALDSTHPGVQAWVHERIQQALDWGFTYLKLDFLYAAALPGVRHTPMPREAAYRAALQAIRKQMGPESYLLACGAPIFATLGVAEGMRIGPDVAPYWDNEERSRLLHDTSGPGAQNALRTSLHRLWLKPLIHTDPDVVYFRTRFNLLSPEEMTPLQALAHIAGFKATSDLPQWLSAEERSQLAQFLEASPTVTRRGRYVYDLDGAMFDFEPLL